MKKLALIALLFLTGCSSTTFVYNRIDFLLPWYLASYVDFTSEQKQSLNERLIPFFKWHRTQELPKYVEIINSLEGLLDNEVKAEDIALITQKNLSNVENNNFKKITLKDIERSVEKYYHFENDKYIGELDILTTYIKGQKNLFTLSKNICQAKLNLLMIPSLLLTCCITIISPIIAPA